MKAKQLRNSCGSAKNNLGSRSALFLQDIEESTIEDQPYYIFVHLGNLSTRAFLPIGISGIDNKQKGRSGPWGSLNPAWRSTF